MELSIQGNHRFSIFRHISKQHMDIQSLLTLPDQNYPSTVIPENAEVGSQTPLPPPPALPQESPVANPYAEAVAAGNRTRYSLTAVTPSSGPAAGCSSAQDLSEIADEDVLLSEPPSESEECVTLNCDSTKSGFLYIQIGKRTDRNIQMQRAFWDLLEKKKKNKKVTQSVYEYLGVHARKIFTYVNNKGGDLNNVDLDSIREEILADKYKKDKSELTKGQKEQLSSADQRLRRVIQIIEELRTALRSGNNSMVE